MKEEIICVLDASGSMMAVKDDALGGFSEFIKAQKEVGEAMLTVVWFDDGYDLAYEGKLSEYVVPDSWPCGGMTALHDAIGKTFKHVKQRFSDEKPDNVIMAILTDGYENCSHEFTKKTVGDLIQEHENKYGWEVIFLAADQDAVAVGAEMNIKASNSINYDSSDSRSGFSELTDSMISYRS